ncbi:Protein DMP [Dillenia turbinata]|uniref:Protein DMP n=1 Tax=Dillenia turbinata TaxID=194707 RepID=A0AAN8ZL20_9MAGN
MSNAQPQNQSSLRARPTKQPSTSETTAPTAPAIATSQIQKTPSSLSRSSSFSQRAISQTLQSTANLANLLPTGTLLAFQLLTPIFTNNGSCDVATRTMTSLLLILLALSCFLACFTDSFKASDGQVYYGMASFKGLYVFDYPAASNSGLPPDLSKYRLSFIDWVHAVASAFVLVAVALRDKNVLTCFYPTPGHQTQEVLDIVPIGIGLICSLLFLVFPTRRHGIGYPVTSGK